MSKKVYTVTSTQLAQTDADKDGEVRWLAYDWSVASISHSTREAAIEFMHSSCESALRDIGPEMTATTPELQDEGLLGIQLSFMAGEGRDTPCRFCWMVTETVLDPTPEEAQEQHERMTRAWDERVARFAGKKKGRPN